MNWLAKNVMPLFFGVAQKSRSIVIENFQIPSAPHGFAYLFARFPSFTQTFCFREVEGMLNQGLQFPIFSIRTPEGEPRQDFPLKLTELTTYLPKNMSLWEKKAPWKERLRIRLLKKQLIKEWGDRADRRRAQEAAWLIPILEKLRVRHVHVHFAGLGARVAYWMKKTAGIRYSFTAHANDFFIQSEYTYLAELIQEAEFIATVTDFSRDWLRERFSNRCSDIHRVYNGISVDQFVRKRILQTPPRILSVGRYIEKKGFSQLIQACAALKNEEFECLIIGEGPLEQALKEQVQQSGLEGKVFITGPRTENEIADLLSGTSVFALPCKKAVDGGMDNLPTVIMEAMAASVPIVATSLAGIPEMVIHGETGFLVKEGDCDDLATSIRIFLQDPTIVKKMGERSRELAKEKFNISTTTRSLRLLLTCYGAICPI